MSIELELKYDLPAEAIPDLLAHPLLAEQPQSDAFLINRYFDTPAGALRAKRWALRTRRKENRAYQTLKGQGTVDGARHARLEWECATPSAAKLHWDIWQGVVPADVLAELAPLWPQLCLQFVTNFHRTQWRIAIPAEQGGGEIEVALDEGAAETHDAHGALLGSTPILEVELEQQGCTEAALQAFAEQLCASLPLTPSAISKAQRGWALVQSGTAV